MLPLNGCLGVRERGCRRCMDFVCKQ